MPILSLNLNLKSIKFNYSKKYRDLFYKFNFIPLNFKYAEIKFVNPYYGGNLNCQKV